MNAAVKAKIAAVAICNINGRDDGWKPPTGITSTVEISISCRNLVNVEILSKSDPMCVVLYQPPGQKKWVPLMRTEVIYNDLDPDFARKALMLYRFDSAQKLRFEIYDVEDEAEKTKSESSLGYCETLLSHIVTAGHEGLTLELIGVSLGMDANQKPETIILTAEELQSEKDEVTLKIIGSSCGKWIACFPPRTMFALSKFNDAGKFIMVYRSKWARGSNPSWPAVIMSVRHLCNGDQDRELKLEVFQEDLKGELHSNGVIRSTLNKLMSHWEKQDTLELSDTLPQLPNAAVRVMDCTLSPIHTFVEYIQAGTQIHCCFAIDFTCSNGDPTDIRSLHFVSRTSNNPNPYEQAIEAVGSILEDYNEVTSFPTYGFGARIPPKGLISYNFNVNLTDDPNCGTVPGVLNAYRECLTKIQLFGPTNFAPIIKTIGTIASKSNKGQDYYVLVIITDGVISDIVKTKKEIVAVSGFPMSIIIIGVGEADFEAMEELDGDAVRISYNGRFAQRDIVQFVAYRNSRSWLASTGERTANELENVEEDEIPPIPAWDNYAGKPREDMDKLLEVTPPAQLEDDKETRMAKSALAREVLAEIPEQLTGYMKSKGILPSSIVKLPREVWVPPKTSAEAEEKWDNVLDAVKSNMDELKDAQEAEGAEQEFNQTTATDAEIV